MLSLGSAAGPFPRAVVGAAQAQSSPAAALAQEDVERLSDAALTLSVRSSSTPGLGIQHE